MKSKQNVRHYLFDVEMLRRRLLRPYFIELGLTVGQGQPRILYELRKCDGMSQKELSDACLIEVTTMSRTLDRLESMGLIKRQNNPECRRSWIISLTEEGKEKADRVSDIFDMAEEVFRKGIGEEELNSMCATLEKIENNLNEAIEEQSTEGNNKQVIVSDNSIQLYYFQIILQSSIICITITNTNNTTFLFALLIRL